MSLEDPRPLGATPQVAVVAERIDGLVMTEPHHSRGAIAAATDAAKRLIQPGCVPRIGERSAHDEVASLVASDELDSRARAECDGHRTVSRWISGRELKERVRRALFKIVTLR